MGRCKAGKVIKEGFTVRIEPIMWRKYGKPCRYCGGMQPINDIGRFETCNSSCPHYCGNADRDCKYFVNDYIYSGELMKYRLSEVPDLVTVLEKASGKYFDEYTKKKLKENPGLAIGFVRDTLMEEMVMRLKYASGVSNDGIRFLFGLSDKEIAELENQGIKNLVSHYTLSGKSIMGGLMDVPNKEEWDESLRRKRLCFSDEQRSVIQQYLSKCSKDTSVKYVTKYRTLPYPKNFISDFFHANGVSVYPEIEDFLVRNKVIDPLVTSKSLSTTQSNVLLMLYVRGYTVKQAAGYLGTSETNIGNIHEKALKTVWREFTYPV